MFQVCAGMISEGLRGTGWFRARQKRAPRARQVFEQLEPRKYLSATGMDLDCAEPEAADVVALQAVPLKKTFEMEVFEGRWEITELDGGQMGPIVGFDINVKKKKVEVDVKTEDTDGSLFNQAFDGKGKDIPDTGFVTQGVGVNKKITLFLDKPVTDGETGETTMTASFIGNPGTPDEFVVSVKLKKIVDVPEENSAVPTALPDLAGDWTMLSVLGELAVDITQKGNKVTVKSEPGQANGDVLMKLKATSDTTLSGKITIKISHEGADPGAGRSQPRSTSKGTATVNVLGPFNLQGVATVKVKKQDPFNVNFELDNDADNEE